VVRWSPSASVSTLTDAAKPGWRARAATAFVAERRRIATFVVVGVLNTAFGYALFAALYLMLQSHRAAAVLAYAGGVLFNYFSTGRLVFDSRNFRALVPFILGYLVILGLNLLLLEILVGWGVNALAAQALSLPPLVVASYLINSRIVFRQRCT
jgi:putative flippase GtrA